MNKFFNSWILFLCIITFPFALAVGMNEDYYFFGLRIPGEEFQYAEIFFSVVSGLVLVLGGLKATRKWMGLNLVRQRDKMSFSTFISDSRMKRLLLYTGIEVFFFMALGLFYSLFVKETQLLGIVLLLLSFEHFLHLSIGLSKRYYRLGITSKAIVQADREVNVVYFKGLKQITKQQQTLFFEYTNDLVLEIPLDAIPELKQMRFIRMLQRKVNPNKVFFSGF